MLQWIEYIICGLVRMVMGRRNYHKVAATVQHLRSVHGVKILGISLVAIFCIFMYWPTLKPAIKRKVQLNSLQVRFEIAVNSAKVNPSVCKEAGAPICSVIKLHLINKGPNPIKNRKWRLYFSLIRRIHQVKSELFTFKHVNGDLNFLTPTSKFEGFSPNERFIIPIVVEMMILSYSDVMPNFYIEDDKENIIVVENTRCTSTFAFGLENNLKRTTDDSSKIQDPQSRFYKNKEDPVPLLERESFEAIALPTPKYVKKLNGKADLSEGVVIGGQGWTSFSNARKAVVVSKFERLGIKVLSERKQRNKMTGHVVTLNKRIWNRYDEIDPYEMEIKEKETEITGGATGLFYGLQTFFSLISLDLSTIPTVKISDSARFKHRGFMLDVARHFKPKSTIFRLLDLMATYKLNIFHFHLSDDEGWRLDIPGLKELVMHGSRRCHNTSECLIPQLGSGPHKDNPGSGFYTVDEYEDIVMYAKANGIKVIPEFDMPGHARAAVMSMEYRFHRLKYSDLEKASEFRLIDPEDTSNVLSVQYFDRTSAINPCLESAYKFIHKVVSEVKQMHKKAGVELDEFNIGGDEARSVLHKDMPWENSPICKKQGLPPQAMLKHFWKNVKIVFDQLNIKRAYAWSDFVGHYPGQEDYFLKKNGAQLYLNIWDSLEWGALERFNKLASLGYKLINTLPDFLYFDMPQEVSPNEKGYYWATRFLNLRKLFSYNPVCIGQNAEYSYDRIGNGLKPQFLSQWPQSNGHPFKWLGMQANLWGETIRTEKDLFYMALPRLVALAERAWHQGPWEFDSQKCIGKTFGLGRPESLHTDLAKLNKEYNQFYNILVQREFPKFDAVGIGYRVPPPGYIVNNGILEANLEFPGFLIQFSLDNGKHWYFYDENEKPNLKDVDEIMVRTVTQSGKQFSQLVNERLKI